jgi:two-component system OmpR family response regulator
MLEDISGGGHPERRLVLLVDLEDDLATCVASALRNAGYDVEIAKGPQQVSCRLRSSSCRMPKMLLAQSRGDTIEAHALSAYVRSSPRLASLAVVLIGEHDTLEARIRALKAGCDEYVTPDTDMMELVARVEAIMRRVR